MNFPHTALFILIAAILTIPATADTPTVYDKDGNFTKQGEAFYINLVSPSLTAMTDDPNFMTPLLWNRILSSSFITDVGEWNVVMSPTYAVVIFVLPTSPSAKTFALGPKELLQLAAIPLPENPRNLTIRYRLMTEALNKLKAAEKEKPGHLEQAFKTLSPSQRDTIPNKVGLSAPLLRSVKPNLQKCGLSLDLKEITGNTVAWLVKKDPTHAAKIQEATFSIFDILPVEGNKALLILANDKTRKLIVFYMVAQKKDNTCAPLEPITFIPQD